jgi:hypothetical protein
MRMNPSTTLQTQGTTTIWLGRNKMTKALLAGTILLLAMAGVTPLSVSATPQRSQAEIARDLLSGNRDRVAAALAEIPVFHDEEDELTWSLAPGYSVTPELAHALVSALEHEARTNLDGGTYTGPTTHLELVLGLAHSVIALRDTVAIPALVQVVSIGWGVRRALLSFGPEVIPDVLAWATSPDAADSDVAGSLYTLAEAVRRWDDVIDGETRNQIKAAATLHLDGPPAHFSSAQNRLSPLLGAIELAGVLGDQDLLPTLETMATSDEEIRNRGGGMAIEWLRREVTEALANAARGPGRGR